MDESSGRCCSFSPQLLNSLEEGVHAAGLGLELYETPKSNNFSHRVVEERAKVIW